MSNSTLAALIQGQEHCNPQDLHVKHARQIIRDFISPIQTCETVDLRDGLSRILAEDVISPIDVPAHDNSAMDGFALQGSGLQADGPTILKIIGTAYAGHAFEQAVHAGQCVRIMTGGVMPPDCDTVIAQESVGKIEDTEIEILSGTVKAGDNRRAKGEDLAAGRPALYQGKRLRPAELGLLASLGIAKVSVFRKLKVACFSTGDELRSLGEALDAGCIYDSNRYTVHGMLQRLGCDIIDMGVVMDDPAALEAALRSACKEADVVITSGGVSQGAADYTRQIMERLGEVAFWNMAMRPGRPMAFGKVASEGNSAYLFGLPGNPVAVMVSFYFFVRDALLQMAGADAAPLPMMQAASTSMIRKRPGRTEYQRGILSVSDDDAAQVRITGAQGSGILRSMSEANCIVVLPHESGHVSPGETVRVILFDGLV